MNSWAPLFSKIVDSSIWAEPDHVCKIFITMLALKDADHVVRYNAFGLAQRAHKTEAEVLDALKVLSNPDTKRLEPQLYEGRRIEKVEGGWLVLNGQFYEDFMRTMNRRAYKAQKQAEYRKKTSKVSSRYLEREKRFVEATEHGDEAKADDIAAEGLPTNG